MGIKEAKKQLKFRGIHFVERFTPSIVFRCVLRQNGHSKNLQTFATFLGKTALKRHFLFFNQQIFYQTLKKA